MPNWLPQGPELRNLFDVGSGAPRAGDLVPAAPLAARAGRADRTAGSCLDTCFCSGMHCTIGTAWVTRLHVELLAMGSVPAG
jgi:hypothetical protein